MYCYSQVRTQSVSSKVVTTDASGAQVLLRLGEFGSPSIDLYMSRDEAHELLNQIESLLELAQGHKDQVA